MRYLRLFKSLFIYYKGYDTKKVEERSVTPIYPFYKMFLFFSKILSKTLIFNLFTVFFYNFQLSIIFTFHRNYRRFLEIFLFFH